MSEEEPMICKWTQQPKCHLAKQVGLSCYGPELKPFECCDDKIAMSKMHCTCQPTTMGFMSSKEYYAVIKPRKDDLRYWTEEGDPT